MRARYCWYCEVVVCSGATVMFEVTPSEVAVVE